MSTLKVHNIEPATGSNLTIGASGDTVTLASDSLKTNAFKDAGGNTLFSSDGAGTVSNINSSLKPAGPILISTQQIEGDQVGTMEFTTGIDNTYDKYMFVFVDLEISYNGSQIVFNGSTNGGSSYGITKTTSVFYTYHNEADNTTNLTYDTGQDVTNTASQPISYGQGGNWPADESLSGIMYLYNPAGAFIKHFQIRTQYYHGTDQSWNFFVGGYFNTTSAINAIKFNSVQGAMVSGKIKLYGIR